MRWLVCLGVFFAVIAANRGVVKAPRPSAAALKGITTLHTVEVMYHSTYGRFATSLQELGPSGANMIDRNLASGEKDGYRFTLVGTPAGYAISATSVEPGKSYFSDQGMRIHVHLGPGPATANDPVQGETEPQRESDPVIPQRDKTNSQATAAL